MAQNGGFCVGVKNAVELAYRTIRENPGKKIYTLGKLIHNELVTEKLKASGVLEAESAEDIEDGSVVIIRSHGAAKSVFAGLSARGVTIADATCMFVKSIQNTVHEHSRKGYQIIILGEAEHPEVQGINGWCDNSAMVVSSEAEAEALRADGGGWTADGKEDNNFPEAPHPTLLIPHSSRFNEAKAPHIHPPPSIPRHPPPKNLCVVAQTTFPADKYTRIVKIIQKQFPKSVEIFDTICYTTHKRQAEAEKIAKLCDTVLVLGSEKSSNTAKLYEICNKSCGQCYLVRSAADLKSIIFKASERVGIVAGASTPAELIMEVKGLMAQQFNNEVLSSEFKDALEESPIKALREGKRVKGTVIIADEKGVSVNIGLKKDGFIPAAEAGLGEYNPADYMPGLKVETVVTSVKTDESGCIGLSKKQVDIIRESDKQVDGIRNGEIFELKIEKETTGGVLGKIGTYAVFIPASQVRESFARDLKLFVGKKLRVTAIEINDKKRRIVASARKVIEEERKAREEIFWSNVGPDVIVNGKVKRLTAFGAFVSVDGIDCLAHMADLSWNRIKNAEDVVKVGKSYDFLVLACDRERNRVSLSYKALQPHPFEACLISHPVGSICRGKVTSIVPFGAFVEIEPGIEGLVHVSEAAHSYVKGLGEVVKVGEEIDVMILNADPNTKKINLSIKACFDAPVHEEAEEEAEETPAIQEAKKPKARKTRGDSAKTTEPAPPPPESGLKPKLKRKPKSEEGTGAEWSEEASNNPLATLLKGLTVDGE